MVAFTSNKVDYSFISLTSFQTDAGVKEPVHVDFLDGSFRVFLNWPRYETFFFLLQRYTGNFYPMLDFDIDIKNDLFFYKENYFFST